MVNFEEGSSFAIARRSQRVSWNGQLATLMPWVDGIQLMPEEQVDVIQGLAGLPGNFQVYVGYRNVAGGITFNVEPLSFTVQ